MSLEKPGATPSPPATEASSTVSTFPLDFQAPGWTCEDSFPCSYPPTLVFVTAV